MLMTMMVTTLVTMMKMSTVMMVMRAVMSERWKTEVNKMLMMMMVTTLVTMLNKIKIFLDAGGRDSV